MNVWQQEERCTHHSTRLVWTKFSGCGDEYQRRQLRRRVDCNRVLGGEQKHSTATEETPELSREEAERWHQQYQENLTQESAREQERREREREEYRDAYHDYLQTPEWAERRELVLRRAKFLCEGCGSAEATQVHHLTYEHACEEFLWVGRHLSRLPRTISWIAVTRTPLPSCAEREKPSGNDTGRN